MKIFSIGNWFHGGRPYIWLTAGGTAFSLLMVIGLLGLIMFRGLAHFWPSPLVALTVTDPRATRPGAEVRLAGEITQEETVPAERVRASGIPVPAATTQVTRFLLKVGNREQSGRDFVWVMRSFVIQDTRPKTLMAVERTEWGNSYGYLRGLREAGKPLSPEAGLWDGLQRRIRRADALRGEIAAIEKKDLGQVNHAMERLRLKQRALELKGRATPEALAVLDRERKGHRARYEVLRSKLAALNRRMGRDELEMELADGKMVTLPLAKVIRAYRPNAMSRWEKSGFYLEKLWEFVSGDPREANTEGGIFPAIFGTVLMVILMSAMVMPLGVVTAIYLHEYARQGWFTRLIRIAVNNLAGVPSIVYGVFGLGFFVYIVGGRLDRIFYPEALPAPTFGTPGLMWAALTLALLTVPVVVVATEEGLTRIPIALREAGLAVGATKAEVLWRIVIPLSLPSMITGLILAISRAAGEVAPLMLVGVVKLAPTLPLDANAPFLHLERKFMHLGFHIYDAGFQSPNVEAARPLVYATAFLLIVVIVTLNMSAIAWRNHLRNKYRTLEN